MKDRVDAILKRPQAEYLDSLLPARDPLLRRMETYAAKHEHPIADPEVAQLMRTLVKAKRPRRIIEVGTNIGYSVIVMARECGPTAVVETIELDRKTLAVAKQFVTEADLLCPVLFHDGAALDVINGARGDVRLRLHRFVKTEYEQYLELLLPKLEPGSMIVCDNLLWKGQIAKGEKDASTKALRRFNRRITTDARLISTVVAVGDGIGISIVV